MRIRESVLSAGTIVDVGAADGTVLAAILGTPQMRGMFDLPLPPAGRCGSAAANRLCAQCSRRGY
jgi:hypothetical protein